MGQRATETSNVSRLQSIDELTFGLLESQSLQGLGEFAGISTPTAQEKTQIQALQVELQRAQQAASRDPRNQFNINTIHAANREISRIQEQIAERGRKSKGGFFQKLEDQANRSFDILGEQLGRIQSGEIFELNPSQEAAFQHQANQQLGQLLGNRVSAGPGSFSSTITGGAISQLAGNLVGQRAQLGLGLNESLINQALSIGQNALSTRLSIGQAPSGPLAALRNLSVQTGTQTKIGPKQSPLGVVLGGLGAGLGAGLGGLIPKLGKG
jgi:hypothetical protein